MMTAFLRTVLAAGVLLAGPGAAQDVVRPSWASLPTQEQMAAAHPMFATLARIEGDVALRCIASADGRLALCEVLSASPAGLGFDRAGLSLVPLFRVNPAQVGGEDRKSPVEFRLRFRNPLQADVLPWTGAEPTPEHLNAVRAFVADSGMDEALQIPDDLGVDADREVVVRAMTQQVADEFRDRLKEAVALSLARLLSPEELSRMTAGGGYPPRPPDDQLERSMDVGSRLEIKAEDRLRSLYCARYDCPAPEAISPTAVQP